MPVNDIYADAKLDSNDRVMSIGAAGNNTKVRGYEVEIDRVILFCVTCVIRKQEEMKDRLKYEFSKYPP